MRRRRTLVAVVALAVVVAWTTAAGRDPDPERPHLAAGASSTVAPPSVAPPSVAPPSVAPSPSTASTTNNPAREAARSTLGRAAGLGPKTAATVPDRTRQAVVVRGGGPGAVTATIELYEVAGDGWRRSGSWQGHVAARGWTDQHREGDLRTPVGTFTLSDAGGRLADPGTTLPYHRSETFEAAGEGVYGESLEGSFDYVIAIDYNRVAGRSPLDDERPQGEERGGGIWLHVDHDGPTHGCVSVPLDGMRTLLRALSPAAHPVVVMGHREWLQD